MHSVHMFKMVLTGKTPSERLRGKNPLQKCVPFGDTVLAKTNLSDATCSEFGSERGATVQNVSSGLQNVYSELVKSEDKKRRIDGTKKPSTVVIGVLWRLTGGRRTVDRSEIRVEPTSNPTIANSVATVGCPACEAIKDNTRSQAHSDRCKVRVEDCFRRKEAINGAVAEELQRVEQRKQKDSRVTTAAPAPKSVASTSHVLS